MARNKTKNWKISSYSLEDEIKEVLKEISEFEGISQSEMIGFLVKNWDAGINPSNKLNILLADRKKVNIKLEEIDKQIGFLTTHIKLFEDWRKQKSQKKGQAIKILQRKILNKEFEDVEKISKVWQRMTGIPAIELISEATQQIKESGI